MDYFVDLFLKHPDKAEELLNSSVKISLKVDGSAFQIAVNDDGEVEYHKRSGNTTTLGPIITDYNRLFSKHLDDAIDFFDSKKDIIQDYKFIAIEIFNDLYVVLNAISRNNEQAGIKEVADRLGIETVPQFFSGKLSKEQKDVLISLFSIDENGDFFEMIESCFNTVNCNKFLKGESEVEGIVLDFVDSNKQYKIINPAFKIRHEEEQKKTKEESLKYTDAINELCKTIFNKANNTCKNFGGSILYNLNYNFIECCKDNDFVDDCLTIAKYLPINTNRFFSVQIDKVNPDIKKILNKDAHLKTVYEQFLMMLSAPKKRAFLVSKEFQVKLNSLINKILGLNEGMMSLRDFIIESLN